MGRLIQVLGFLMSTSRIAVKTGRIILLLSPEGHLMFYAPPLEGKAWSADPAKSPVMLKSTIQRRSTNRRVYRSRGPVVRRIGCSGYVGPFHLEAMQSSVSLRVAGSRYERAMRGFHNERPRDSG